MSSAAVFAEQQVRLESCAISSSTVGIAETRWKPPSEPADIDLPSLELKDTTHAVDVTILARHSDWLTASIRALSRFSKLESNWDSYGAEAPTAQAIASGRRLLQILDELDFEPSSIDPSVEGGVCMSFASKGSYGDIECFNSGEIFAVTSKAGDEPIAWRVESDDAGIRGAVATIKSFIVHSAALSK